MGQASLVQRFQSSYALDMRILITGDRHWRCDDVAKGLKRRLRRPVRASALLPPGSIARVRSMMTGGERRIAFAKPSRRGFPSI
jgi:hypothetical protein